MRLAKSKQARCADGGWRDGPHAGCANSTREPGVTSCAISKFPCKSRVAVVGLGCAKREIGGHRVVERNSH